MLVKDFQKWWHKTVVVWNFISEIKTDIPVTDWHDHKVKRVHAIRCITATSMPDETGRIELEIKSVSGNPNKGAVKKINKQLKQHLQKEGRADKVVDHVYSSDTCTSIFIIEFSFENMDRFCDTTVEVVTQIFEALQAEDPNSSRLSDFKVTQQTFVQIDDVWVTMKRWVQISRQLPIWNDR